MTQARFDDTSPAFTLDGKYLAFLSNRTFDPVYDAHAFDLGFLPGVRPYLVTLLADTPSPFAPELSGGAVSPGRTGTAAGPEARHGPPEPAWTSPGWPNGSCRSRWRPGATASFARSGAAWSGWTCRAPGSSARP